MKIGNSAALIATRKASAPPLLPSQKVHCYQSFEKFEKRVAKLHLPKNWKINSLSNYYRVLNTTQFMISLYLMYILEAI